jgi:hypothetical protein
MKVRAGLLGILAALAAGVARSADLDASVPGHPNLTYADLLKQVVPDLDGDGHGHLRRPARHLADRQMDVDASEPLTVTEPDTLHIRAGGQVRMVVMADIGGSDDRVESNTLIALFDDGPHPRLLDTALVGLDRDTGFSEVKPLNLGPDDQAFITYSEHFNSNQTYAGRFVVFVRRDRFSVIEQLFNLSDRACGWERLQEPSFATAPDRGSPYRQLIISVRQTTTVDPSEDCGEERPPRRGVANFTAIYRWNARLGRFTTTSTALKRLDKINAASF